MLKITRLSGADHGTLLLEGNLVKEWVAELQQVLAQARQDATVIALDLVGLRFVDEEGAELLRESRKHGATLRGASPFVSAVLDPLPPPLRHPGSSS